VEADRIPADEAQRDLKALLAAYRPADMPGHLAARIEQAIASEAAKRDAAKGSTAPRRERELAHCVH
jgi:hypothetical protein